ncbi:MAG: methyltransferase domain-containing protein [Planctomycetota bacterium]
MDRISIPIDASKEPAYLNLGCGRNFHSSWVNVDLGPIHADVIEHDITDGIPFDNDSFDAVYHSHVLEHLNPDQGKTLIRECNRVLKPGGVLRVVVPDLERIAILYLEMLDEAWQGNRNSRINYDWMKLELLDQMVRDQSGGRMGPYMADSEIENSRFVMERLGDEFLVCQNQNRDIKTSSTQSKWALFANSFSRLKLRMAFRVVRWLLGRKAEKAFREGLFRSQGEIHRWMYDRYSLKDICESAGFDEFKVCYADESRIDSFTSFDLDTVSGKVRKPDSLFVECVKGVAAEIVASQGATTIESRSA